MPPLDQTNTRPNVLFLFTDQQRWDTVGCYGSGMDLTPNLDRMAEQGVRFDLAFTPQPVCGPARACLQTGLYPTTLGCFRNSIPLPPNARTLAHFYREAGYEVGYIGKWHLADTDDRPVPAERRGGYADYWLAADILEFSSQPYGGGYFDGDNQFVPFNGYRVNSQTDHVLEYLRTRTLDKPFFLFLSYLEPHHQNRRPNLGPEYAIDRYVAPKGYADRYRDYPVPGDLTDHGGDWRENLADYYGICANIDENLGRILAELDALGIADNTVIVYTSDHGTHFRTRNREYKRSCHEASIRIPLVVRGPGFQGGKVIEELVSLVDLPPTLLEIAGTPAPDYFHGRSLLPLVQGNATDWPQEVFVQISESQVGRAIRTRRWKYGVDAPDRKGGEHPNSPVYVEQYLYDLESDPHEQRNLIGVPDLRPVADELAALLVQRMVAAGEAPPRIIPHTES